MIVNSSRLAVAAVVGATVAAVAAYLRHRRRLPAPEVEAYCQPCDEEFEPAVKQRTHHLVRQRTLSGLSRQKSVVNDDLLAWMDYAKEPTLLFGSPGFIPGVGVQKIELPFAAHEIDKVARWMEDEEQSGMGALRPLHRLSTPERLDDFKAQFGSLDLGSYDDLAAAATSSVKEPGSAEFNALIWTILIIEPNRFFPLHAHPQGEVIYCARGALYENRVLTSALVNAPTTSLVDSGFPKLYSVHKRTGGEAFANPRFSVHQSYTLDEGAVLFVLWCGRHANLTDPTNAMWDVKRCQNPWCAMACPGGTYEALARKGGSGPAAELH